jgi:hypothetical protein
MSEVQAVQSTCGAEKSPAGCGQNGASPVMEEQPRKKTRGAATATITAKSEFSLSGVRVQQSASGRSVRKSAGRAAAAKPSVSGDGYVADDVMSVEELEPMILRDPDNRKKRLTLAEALREHGLDEPKVAAVYAGLVKKLSRNKHEGPVGVAAAKLLFDILKEVTHSHEPQKTTGNSDSSDLPPFVRLIHNVPRPVRTE